MQKQTSITFTKDELEAATDSFINGYRMYDKAALLAFLAKVKIAHDELCSPTTRDIDPFAPIPTISLAKQE